MTSKEFLLAQTRIAARRQQQGHHAPTSHSPRTRSPYSLEGLQEASAVTWSKIRGREGTWPAFRVAQVDAELLDEELLELLKAQVAEGLKYFGSHVHDDWSAEILLALRAVLFKLTLWDHNTTYGAALQNLHYVDVRRGSNAQASPSQWQKALYGLSTVGGRYAWVKWNDWLLDREGGVGEPPWSHQLLSRTTSALSLAHSIAGFVSFLVFLTNGRYRTLIDRILRLRLSPTTDRVRREVSFDYLNRQLVWHTFTEFLLFVLPLVGVSQWRRWLYRALRSFKSMLSSGSSSSDSQTEPMGELSFLPERTCPICYQSQNPPTTSEQGVMAISNAFGGLIGSGQTDVTNPYEALPCGCIYCFVCIAQNLEAEEGHGWICLRCGVLIKECQPWAGDVVEEVERRGDTGRKVGFESEISGSEESSFSDKR